MDENADDFTEEDVPIFAAKCQEYQEQLDAARDEDVSKLDNFKKLINWALWNESFQNHLRQILSGAKIPLIYLTRDEKDDDEVPDPDNFETTNEYYLIKATVFEGQHYNLDNPRFYRELKSFVVNGEG